nr:uncharacterized protein LOC104087169 [Nicotiana tomentosiformis]
MGSPWPFSAWGTDVIGPIDLAASNGHRFILVAIDYFIKWVKASTYKVVTKKVVADFVTYRSQMNGEVEASNNNIKRILRKIVDNHRQWHEKLSFALLGYRTTMRSSTGAMLYILVYGTAIVIPVEVEIPSLRVIQEAKLDDVERIQVRQEQLMLINEKKIDEVCHGHLYQNRIASAFNKRVKPRQLISGKLVL